MPHSDEPLIRRFAQWGAGFRLAELPPSAREQALLAILDVLGAMAAGSSHPIVASVRRVFATDLGRSTVCGGHSSSAAGAAMVNGTAAHVWDFDDTSYTGIMHGSAVVFPAVLAAAEAAGASDDELLAAFVVGSEVAYTLAEVVSHGHYFKGWWSTATLGLLGATAGAARAYSLDAASTAHALGLAAAGAGTSKCLFGTDGKPFLVGETARRAVDFARVAAAGLTGPVGALEDSRGFFALLNAGQSKPEQAATLGSRWRLQDPGLLFKSSPVCSAVHAVIEAIGELMTLNGVTPSQIARIHCHVPHLVKISLTFDHPESAQEAQFSLPYAAACAVLYGRVRLEDLAPAEVVSNTKRALMSKVEYQMSPELSTEPMRARYPESARVCLILESGKTLEAFCGEALGMPGRPLGAERLWEKFAACMRFAGIPATRLAAARDLPAAPSREPLPLAGIARSVLAAPLSRGPANGND